MMMLANHANPKSFPKSFFRAPFTIHHAASRALFALLVLAAGCNAKLPEPESPGAKLYAARCNDCHRLYAPGLMKFPMWKNWVHRMQGEFIRRGIPPLTPDEEALLLAYLERHSGPPR